MTLPKSIGAYGDCEEHFARAAASERGIAIRLADPQLATRFKQRMNVYRVMLRRQSSKAFPPDDPRYGVSPYDSLQLTTDPNDPDRVLIRPYSLEIQSIEEL